MRRSKLIDKLATEMNSSMWDLYEGEITITQFYIKVLDIVEEQGMLPPATTIFNTDDDNMPIWEPENE